MMERGGIKFIYFAISLMFFINWKRFLKNVAYLFYKIIMYKQKGILKENKQNKTDEPLIRYYPLAKGQISMVQINSRIYR